MDGRSVTRMKNNMDLELITPKVAEAWLTRRHTKQRNIQKLWVKTLAHSMSSGNWDENICEPLKFNAKGELMDGQHRLSAIVESGASVYMWIQRNLPDESFICMDNGKRREISNFIKCDNATTVSSFAKCAYLTEISPRESVEVTFNLGYKGGKDFAGMVGREEVIQYVDSHLQEFEEIGRMTRKLRASLGSGSVAALGYFVWLIWYVGDKTKLLDFLDEFAMDVPTSKTVAACRHKIMKRNTPSMKSDPVWLLKIMLCAYDKYCKGKDETSFGNLDGVAKRYGAKCQERAGKG